MRDIRIRQGSFKGNLLGPNPSRCNKILDEFNGPRNLNKHSPTPQEIINLKGSSAVLNPGDIFLLSSDIFWYQKIIVNILKNAGAFVTGTWMPSCPQEWLEISYAKVKKSDYIKPITLLYTGQMIYYNSGAPDYYPKCALEFFVDEKKFFASTDLLFASVLSYYQMQYSAMRKGEIKNIKQERWPGYNEYSLKLHEAKNKKDEARWMFNA